MNACLPANLIQRWLVDSSPVVYCPSCDETYTHFRGVEYCASGGEPVTVTFRHGEDDPHVSVMVEHGATLSRHGPVEPSPRRGSVMLVFECEQCTTVFGLAFEQHKGNEFVHLASFGPEAAQ